MKFLGPAVAFVLAAVMLLWCLDRPYLWQDEAATAVLAERMLRFGRPLAYDGVNLITTDNFAAEDKSTIDQRTTNAQADIGYYIRKGDLKPDTTWKWQPWGSFVVCAASLAVLGKTTVAARLPFALAGILTVLLLYWLALDCLKRRLTAFFAAVFLALNSYWILHSRQCRYYALSSLLLVLTVFAYLRWQQNRRWGAPLFVASAFLWFQCDYGTIWPVLIVLFIDAFIAQRKKPLPVILTGGALAAVILPFAYSYELLGRHGGQELSWWLIFQSNLFNLNDYITPVIVLAGALWLLFAKWKGLAEPERRLIAIACGIWLALAFWIPSVAPAGFLRYVIMAAPMGCLLGAWVVVRVSGRYFELAYCGALVWILTPWLSLPLHPLFSLPPWYKQGSIVRPELPIMMDQIFGNPQDPNRGTVEWLRANTKPTDEILINYEDIPLMFYLPNPIRGGIAAFRAEDDSKMPPAVIILRRSVGFYHVAVFQREIGRYHWKQAEVDIPDRMWGNNPDPIAMNQPSAGSSVVILQRDLTPK